MIWYWTDDDCYRWWYLWRQSILIVIIVDDDTVMIWWSMTLLRYSVMWLIPPALWCRYGLIVDTGIYVCLASDVIVRRWPGYWCGDLLHCGTGMVLNALLDAILEFVDALSCSLLLPVMTLSGILLLRCRLLDTATWLRRPRACILRWLITVIGALHCLVVIVPVAVEFVTVLIVITRCYDYVLRDCSVLGIAITVVSSFCSWNAIIVIRIAFHVYRVSCRYVSCYVAVTFFRCVGVIPLALELYWNCCVRGWFCRYWWCIVPLAHCCMLDTVPSAFLYAIRHGFLNVVRCVWVVVTLLCVLLLLFVLYCLTLPMVWWNSLNSRLDYNTVLLPVLGWWYLPVASSVCGYCRYTLIYSALLLYITGCGMDLSPCPLAIPCRCDLRYRVPVWIPVGSTCDGIAGVRDAGASAVMTMCR